MLTVPPALREIQSQAGAHRRGLKVLFYGPQKSGKSFALASFPHPIVAGACGEAGIQPYLDPSKGDICFDINTPDDYEGVLAFAIEHENEIGSLVLDNYNLLWEDWRDAWEDTLGVEELRGNHWKKVKGPWKVALRKIMRSRMHFGCSAWVRDILYTQEEAGPGVEGKVKIVAQDNPAVEKTIPYAVDLIFKTEVVLDKLSRPTNKHRVVFYGGRRPRTVPPTDLYTGKVWTFDSKLPGSVWDTVIAPFYEKWTDGAVDHLGAVPGSETAAVLADVEQTANDEIVGRLMRVIDGATDFAVYKAEIFPKEVQPELLQLPAALREKVHAYHKAHVAKIQGGK